MYSPQVNHLLEGKNYPYLLLWRTLSDAGKETPLSPGYILQPSFIYTKTDSLN